MRVRLAVRDWDFITPLLLGDVRAEGVELEVQRVEALPEDLATDARFDAAEMSLSRYCLARAAGREDIVGLPHFIMRAFRHRCIIAAKTSRLETIAQLRGARIGLAGWQDSGNTWTRAILRREGIGVEDAQWRISRLAAHHPIIDRLGPFGRPGLIEAVADDRPLLDMLAAGELDAVFMPFMPAGFYGPDSLFRQLLSDFVAAERDYFRAVRYVPGIHLVGVKASAAAAQPGVGAAISRALDRSAALWAEKRLRYAETTPWLLDDLRRTARDLPAGWDANGLPANRAMIADFLDEQIAQGLTRRRMTPEDIFAQDSRETAA